MGESLGLFKSRMPDHKLPLYILKRVSRQLLQALDYTHACGLAHTGIYLAEGTCSSLLLLPYVSLRYKPCELDGTVITLLLKAIPKPHVLVKVPQNRPVPSTGMRVLVDVRNLKIRRYKNRNIRLGLLMHTGKNSKLRRIRHISWKSLVLTIGTVDLAGPTVRPEPIRTPN